jgi:hypothetical protein
MSGVLEFGPSHWLTDGSPANAGYRAAAGGLSPACPYEAYTHACRQWWIGYYEGCYSFGPPRVQAVLAAGLDHPEWV